MSDYELTGAELLAARQALRDDERRAIERHPDSRAEIEDDYREQHVALDELVLDRTQMLSAHKSWIDRIGTDGPLPAQLMQLLLEVPDDESLYEVVRDIASRFEEAAQPAPEPEPELSDLIGPIDANNPFMGHRPAPKADPWAPQTVTPGTHTEPLGPLQPSREPRTTRTKPLTDNMEGQTARPPRMIGTATHAQYEEANLRRRREAERTRS